MTTQRESRPVEDQAAFKDPGQDHPQDTNGHKPNGLRATIEATGGSLGSMTVMGESKDPFRLDTPANHRDGQWVANRMDALGIGRIHNRGLHYALLGQPKPDGTPYATTDWLWLCAAIKAARWLGYVPFDRINDQRSDPPEIRLWTPPTTPWPHVYRPSASVNVEVRIPDDFTPRAWVMGFTAAQPYHLVLVGEKSSLRDVLAPIADRYQADLYLGTGDLSDSMIHTMAESGVRDGRPLVALYFSDADPSGYNMPIALARKLQAFNASLYPQLGFRVRRACLTPDQVRRYNLPDSPLKEGEGRADKWRKAFGVEQTEIDALATLQPDLLRELARDAIALFYDHTLERRVRRAEREWQEQAQAIIDEQTGDSEQLDHAAAQLAEKRDQIEEIRAEMEGIVDTLRADEPMFNLPPLPAVPVAELDPDQSPSKEEVCDSRWNFAEQTRWLIAQKNYRDSEVG